MGWTILQLSIFIGVVFSNIYYQWTPNALLASLIGVGTAMWVTGAINWIGDKRRAYRNSRDSRTASRAGPPR